MSVAKIRTQITLDANNAQVALDRLSRSVGNFSKALGGTKSGFESLNNGIKATNSDVLTLTKSIAIATSSLKAFERFSGVIGKVFQGAYNYTTTLESNAVGMSGILSSMTTLNGKQLEWNKAMAISRDIMNDLRETALQTASTAPELIDTFRALLGPGMGAGMNVQEIMKLTTVGVNAVKSMGLDGVQLVQELRSIVQGNIRPASSTLATALGISNADVKQAIASSDGLFKFLMERLKGFEMSVGETSKTIKGRIAILNEALYQAIEKSGTEAFDEIRYGLQDLTRIIMTIDDKTNKFKINEEFVEQISKINSFIADIIRNVGQISNSLLKNFGGLTDAFLFFMKTELYIGVGGSILAGIGKFADYLLKAQNSIRIIANDLYGFFSPIDRIGKTEKDIADKLQQQENYVKNIETYNQRVLKNILNEVNAHKQITKLMEKEQDLFNKNRASLAGYFGNGDVKAWNDINTIINLGKKMNLNNNEIQKWINKYVKDYEKGGREHAEAYVRAFKNAFQQFNVNDVVKNIRQKALDLTGKDSASFSNQDVFNLFNGRASLLNGSNLSIIREYDEAFISLAETMKKAGVSQSVLTQRYIDFNKEFVKSGGDITKIKDKINLQDMKDLEQNLKAQIVRENTINGINALGTALTSLGFAYQYVTSDNESLLGSMAQWGIQAGTVIGAVAQIGNAYMELKTIVDTLTKSEALLKAVQTGVIGGLALVTIGGFMYAGYTKYQAYKKGGSSNFTYDTDGFDDSVNIKMPEAYSNPADDFMNKELNRQALEKKKEKLENLKPNYGGGDSFGGGGKASREADKAKRLQQQADNAKRSYDELIASIRVANAGLDTHADEYVKKNAEIDKQVQKWTDSFEKLKDKRSFSESEETTIKNLIADYKELAKAENERNKQMQEYANEMQRINNLQTIGSITTREANQLRINTLREEINDLYRMIPLYENNAKKRLEIETQVAQKIKEIREAEATDGKVHWDNVLDHIRNTTYNLTETINSGISGMFDSIANFGQNLLTESKSIADRFKDLFKNLANDLLNMIMKVIMQGLIMNAILGIGGKGSTKGINATSNARANAFSSVSMASNGKYFAKGGYASGWSIVGEQGPELVNFSNPARVYTAEQTRNALNGSGGNVNIKIDLKNESGQQLQAEQTGSAFDGESYIVSVVLKAIQSNKGGMRTMMKGLANA